MLFKQSKGVILIRPQKVKLFRFPMSPTKTVFKLKVSKYIELINHHQYSSLTSGCKLLGDSLPTPVPLPEENLRALAEFEAAYATGKT